MAYLTCPHGVRFDLFGPSRCPEFATRMGIPFLGSLPIFPELPSLADDGRVEELRTPQLSLIARRVRLLLDRLRSSRDKPAPSPPKSDPRKEG